MRQSICFFLTLAATLALGIVAAHSSAALDLDPQFKVYHEDFDDEFAFSTDADVDLVGFEGLDGFGLGPSGSLSIPSLNGENVRAFVGGGFANDVLQRVVTSGTVSDPIASFALRGRFDNLTNPPPALGTFAAVRAALVPNPGTLGLIVSAGLQVDEITGQLFLFVAESEVSPGGLSTSNAQTLPLPFAAYAAVRDAGAAFTIDLELDRTSATPRATATVDIEGQPLEGVGPLSLGFFVSNQLTNAMMDLSLDGVSGDPTPAEINFEALSVYFYFTSTFSVDTFDDTPDATIGDAFCVSTNGMCSLRAAIQESNALMGPGRINVPAGQYDLTRVGTGDDVASRGDLDILDGLEIRGAGRTSTIIDGVADDRVFEVPSAALNTPVRLRDLGIQNGFARANGSDTGGGIQSFGRLALERCVVNNNLAGQGAGITNARVLFMDDCVVRDNLTRNLFSTRRAGGIAAPAFGGVFGSNYITHIRNSAIVGNEDPVIGGAEFSGADSVKIENTTLSGDAGVLLQLTNSDAALRHATLVGGSQTALQVGSTGSPATVEITNTAVEGNSACNLSSNPAVTYIYDGNNASDDVGCGFTSPGSIENTNLLLGPLMPLMDSQAHVPQTGSPLIDAADLVRCPVDDQIFDFRPQLGSIGGTFDCDIGAIEVPEADARVMWIAGILFLVGLATPRNRSHQHQRAVLAR